MNMRNLLPVVTLFSLLTACKNNDCPAKIDLVQPGENPPQYEVVIRPEGFSQQATVRFGQEVAASRPGNDNDIIARVPAGLRGNVEISLEENDCIGRKNFIVLDSLPGTYGMSLQNIVLPTPPNFPGVITNEWMNDADTLHSFVLDQDPDNFTQLANFCVELSLDNPVLNNNPISGAWSENPNTIYIKVDRTQNGGTIEEFDGQFTGPYPGARPWAKFFILLTSRTTGRQMILYRQ